MGASNRDGALLTEINVTPLVDVVLVLLVVLMVAATALAQKTITVEVPKAKSGDGATKKDPLVVVVTEGGVLYIDDARVSDDQIRARARGSASAVIAADGKARHEVVVHALDLLRGEQVQKVGIVVRAAPEADSR